MAITTINVGTNPNDGTGDSLRTSFTICNNNFSYLESIISGNGIVSANSLIISGNVLLGESLSFAPPGAALQYGGTANSYVQMVIQNKSSLTNASSDYVVTADNGDDANYFGDFGIASSTYYYEGYDSILPNDTYLIANGGNLLLNAGSPGKAIKFVANGSNNADIAGQFSNTGLVINPTTTSTGVGSGALQVAGGASIAGDMYTGGNISTANDIVSGNGLVATNPFGGTLTTGVAFDYITGNGRISLSSATDGLVLFNNGLAGFQLAEFSNVGNLTVTGDIRSVNASITSNLTLLTANTTISGATDFNLANVRSISYAGQNLLGSNVTSVTANLSLGRVTKIAIDVNANVSLGYGVISPGYEKTYFVRNVDLVSTANIILPNANNNKGTNVIPISPGTVASVYLIAVDDTAANVVATIINN